MFMRPVPEARFDLTGFPTTCLLGSFQKFSFTDPLKARSKDWAFFCLKGLSARAAALTRPEPSIIASIAGPRRARSQLTAQRQQCVLIRSKIYWVHPHEMFFPRSGFAAGYGGAPGVCLE